MVTETGFNPNIIFRGALIAAIVLILLTSAVTADASPPEPRIEKVVLTNTENNNTNTEAANDSTEQSIGCLVSDKFPESVIRWCELITFYSEKNGLPADLVAALIWQESGGKPKAYSRSGAVGLMQVMPRDGLAAAFMCKNGPCFSNRPTIKELEDPEFNVKYGTNMLARLVKKRGNMREALKSYGPMDVGFGYADKVLSLYKQYGN